MFQGALTLSQVPTNGLTLSHLIQVAQQVTTGTSSFHLRGAVVNHDIVYNHHSSEVPGIGEETIFEDLAMETIHYVILQTPVISITTAAPSTFSLIQSIKGNYLFYPRATDSLAARLGQHETQADNYIDQHTSRPYSARHQVDPTQIYHSMLEQFQERPGPLIRPPAIPVRSQAVSYRPYSDATTQNHRRPPPDAPSHTSIANFSDFPDYRSSFPSPLSFSQPNSSNTQPTIPYSGKFTNFLDRVGQVVNTLGLAIPVVNMMRSIMVKKLTDKDTTAPHWFIKCIILQQVDNVLDNLQAQCWPSKDAIKIAEMTEWFQSKLIEYEAYPDVFKETLAVAKPCSPQRLTPSQLDCTECLD